MALWYVVISKLKTHNASMIGIYILDRCCYVNISNTPSIIYCMSEMYMYYTHSCVLNIHIIY